MLTAGRVTYLDRARKAYDEALAAEGLDAEGQAHDATTAAFSGWSDSGTTARLLKIAVRVADAVTPNTEADLIQALEDDGSLWLHYVEGAGADEDVCLFQLARLVIRKRIVRGLTGTE